MTKQQERVLEYIKGGNKITSLDAFNQLGITRLAAVIFDLKKDGYFIDRKSTRLNSSHGYISYAVFCLKQTTELQSQLHIVCCLLLDKKN